MWLLNRQVIYVGSATEGRMKTVHQWCLCFLLLSQQLFLLTAASVVRSVELEVPTTWQKIFVYNNRHTYPVRGMSRWSKGLKTHITGKTLTADRDEGEDVFIGETFQLSSINVTFTDGRSLQEEQLTQDDIYSSKRIHTTYVTIPPLTKLTRWQLVAMVAGHEIGFERFVDTHGNEKPPPQLKDFLRTGGKYDDGYIGDRASNMKQLQRHNSVGHAMVLVGESLSMQPIHYGSTKIRIKHVFTNQYLTVFRSYRKLAATLLLSPDFHFILYSSPNGTKIKTLNPLSFQPRQQWLSASGASGTIYFEDENARTNVYWTLSKEGQLYDGDTVTISNNHHRGSGLCYFHKAPSTNVYTLAGRKDEWILEVV